MIKTVGYTWYTASNGTIGIVLGYDDITDKLKAWIDSVIGKSKEYDITHITEWGAKFPVAEAISIIDKTGLYVMEKDGEEPLKSKEHAW